MLEIEMMVVGLLLLPMALIAWSTFRYGISPMPSSSRAQQMMLSLVPGDTGPSFIELGSGWGQLAYKIAQTHPTKVVIGYERSIIPYVFSRLVFRAPNLRFHYRDFLHEEFSQDSVLFCYLYPYGMKRLQQHLRGSTVWVISHCFAFDGHQPRQQLQLSDLYQTPIYLYKLNPE